MSLIKTPTQLSDLKVAGKLLQQVFDVVAQTIKPGVSTDELDQVINTTMRRLQTKPSFLHYFGFPKSSCISINDQVIHGIPSDTALKLGDIVTVDAGLWYHKVCVDAARTYAIGTVPSEAMELLTVTKQALTAGVKAVQPGNHIGAISAAVEQVATKHHLGIVRNYTGHGVGVAVHEEPSIPNYGKPGDGIVMQPGMVLAIEPMFTLGGGEVVTLSDGWTVITNDGSLAAQFEHTVIVTKEGHEVVV